jgi:cold shock CspA family protein
MKRMGLVEWFDDSAGEGMIYDLAVGRSLYVHYSAIKNDMPRKTLLKHDLVEMSLYRNLYMTQVDECKVLEPDFNYREVTTCLEMCFRRGIDPLKLETRYA